MISETFSVIKSGISMGILLCRIPDRTKKRIYCVHVHLGTSRGSGWTSYWLQTWFICSHMAFHRKNRILHIFSSQNHIFWARSMPKTMEKTMKSWIFSWFFKEIMLWLQLNHILRPNVICNAWKCILQSTNFEKHHGRVSGSYSQVLSKLSNVIIPKYAIRVVPQMNHNSKSRKSL